MANVRVADASSPMLRRQDGIADAAKRYGELLSAGRTEARSRLPVGSLRLSVENGKPSDGLDATSRVNWLLLATWGLKR